MDRNNGRYSYNRRQGGPHHNNQSLSLSSTTTNNNHHHFDNHSHHNNHHRNTSSSSSTATSSSSSSSASSASSQYSTNTTNNSTSGYGSTQSMNNAMREPLTQHDELIRYIREAWTKVNEHGTPVIYHNDPDHQLKNFKPFNLEEYWGQRLVQNIHVSHGHQ